MNAQELYREWTEGESTGMRPQRVAQVREDIKQHTDIPVPRSIPAIEAWLPDYKGQVTRRLREHPQVSAENDSVDEGDDQ